MWLRYGGWQRGAEHHAHAALRPDRDDPPPDGDLSALYTKNQTLFGTFLTREAKRLGEMTLLFERGQARVVADEVLPLAQVARAHERLDSGHGRSKVTLSVADA